MTSGDESDNEDLTDASSESEWFEFAGTCAPYLHKTTNFIEVSRKRLIAHALFSCYTSLHCPSPRATGIVGSAALYPHESTLSCVNTKCIAEFPVIAGSYASR